MRYRLENNRGGGKMKIAIPTMENKGMADYVSEHFGKAPTFTVVDLATNEVTVIPNTSEHMGGSGYPPEIMAKAKVEVML